MKKHSSVQHKYFKTILVILFIVFIIGLFFIFHQTQAAISDLNPTGISTNYSGDITSVISTGIGYAIRGVLYFIGAIMFTIIVYGGFLILTSAGNTDRLGKGKTTLTWAVIGLIIVLTSNATVSFIFQTTPPSGGSGSGDSGTDLPATADVTGTTECVDALGTGYHCISSTVVEDPRAFTPTTPGDDSTADCHPGKTACTFNGVSNAGWCCKTSYTGLVTSSGGLTCNGCSDAPAAGSSSPYYTNLISKCLSFTSPTTSSDVDKSSLKISGVDSSRIFLESGSSGNTGRVSYTPKSPPDPNPEPINYEVCLNAPSGGGTPDCCSNTLTIFPPGSSTVPPSCNNPSFTLSLTALNTFQEYPSEIDVFPTIVNDTATPKGSLAFTGSCPGNIQFLARPDNKYKFSASHDGNASTPTDCRLPYKYTAAAGSCTGTITLQLTVPVPPPVMCDDTTSPLHNVCQEYKDPSTGTKQCTPVWRVKNESGLPATCVQENIGASNSCCDCGYPGSSTSGWVCKSFATETDRRNYYNANRSNCAWLHCGNDLAGDLDICCKP